MTQIKLTTDDNLQTEAGLNGSVMQLLDLDVPRVVSSTPVTGHA